MSGRPWWASEGPGGDGAGAGSAREDASTTDGPTHRHRADAPRDVCQVCPICAILRTVDDVRPELVEHLTEAARHLTLAAKAFVDAQAAGFEGDEGLQRIDLDE